MSELTERWKQTMAAFQRAMGAVTISYARCDASLGVLFHRRG